jgi:hypothetical protein
LNGRTYDEMPNQLASRVPSKAERLELVRAAEYLADGWSDSPLVRVESRRVVA